MNDDDIELLIEDIEILKDEIYSDEHTINIVENTIIHLKNEYNLLSNKKKIKIKAFINNLKNFILKATISSVIILIICLFSTLNIEILAVINVIIFAGYDIKKWLKDTEEIRFLEKNTSIDSLLVSIRNQEENLNELKQELNLNKLKLKKLKDIIQSTKKESLIIDYRTIGNKEFSDKPLVLNRLKKTS